MSCDWPGGITWPVLFGGKQQLIRKKLIKNNLIRKTCLCGLLSSCLNHWALADEDKDKWVLKSENYLLSLQTLEQTLAARGFTAESVSPAQRKALLRELFIRDSLLRQQQQIPKSALSAFETKLDDYRRSQLAKLTLDVLSESDMPDFSKRARELYEVQKEQKYRLPLRLRVRVLRKSLTDAAGGTPPAREQVITGLQKVLAGIQEGKLDFKQAVLQYSDEPNRKLTAGDSFWFQQGQKSDVLFATAKTLNSTRPISKIVVDNKYAYVLQFIGRQ
ncbi:MAG: peptidylprolyl isomerase, partial [Thiolinea sp.]